MNPYEAHYALVVKYADSSKDYRSKQVYQGFGHAQNRVAQITLEDGDVQVVSVKQICDLSVYEWSLPSRRA